MMKKLGDGEVVIEQPWSEFLAAVARRSWKFSEVEGHRGEIMGRMTADDLGAGCTWLGVEVEPGLHATRFTRENGEWITHRQVWVANDNLTTDPRFDARVRADLLAACGLVEPEVTL